MKNAKPSTAAQALIRLVEDLPIYRDGDYLSGVISLAGFDVIAHGSFAVVMEGLPGQVIKVFNNNDLGYKTLLNEFMTNTSEHYPKIFSYTEVGNYTVVELEKLEIKFKDAVKLSTYADRVVSDKKLKDHPWGDDVKNVITRLKGLISAGNKETVSNTFNWDGHEHNILFRGTTPVFADVIFGEL